jgi:hypothetical protein
MRHLKINLCISFLIVSNVEVKYGNSTCEESQDSAVGMTTGYWLDNQGVRV